MKKMILGLAISAILALAADFTNSIGMKFKEIPAGSFTMGANVNCPKDNPFTEKNEYLECIYSNGYLADEMPAHRVTLKSFYMQETEVTQGQWYAIMGNNPAKFKTGDENLPVEQVSWDDAKEFIRRLNAKEKTNKYRLPTEAEWEYAARAGTTTKWYCGDNESCLDDIAWYDGNSGNRTHTVATKSPNAWGLYDMSGNVSEWTDSCWSDDYNSGQNCKYRSLRGASWHVGAHLTHSAARSDWTPGSRDDGVGFRLLRTK